MFNELAIKFKNNKNNENFNLIYIKIKPSLTLWVKKFMSNDLEIVEEVVNDTMLIIWNKIDSFDPEKASFKTWVWTISKRICFSLLEKKKQNYTFSIESMKEKYGFDIPESEEPSLDVEQLLSLVVNEINNLEPKYRDFFIDVYKYKLPHQEIAKKRNVAPYTVKNRLFKGRQIIKQNLNNKHVDNIFNQGIN